MSSVEDGKTSCPAEDCTELAEKSPSGHVSSLPGDVWAIILTMFPARTAYRLACTSSWMLSMFYSQLCRLDMWTIVSAFPAARFTSLEAVELGYMVNLDVVLPMLAACPAMHTLTVYIDSPARADLLDNLPRLPQLQTVRLNRILVNSALGKALASCASLQRVELDMLPVDEEDDDSAVAAFLSQLCGCGGLRGLTGLKVRREETIDQLCSAMRHWPALQELRVSFDMFEEEPELDNVLSTLATCCPQLQRLAYHTHVYEFALPACEMAALGRMKQLQQLLLYEMTLPSTFFDDVSTLPSLQELSLPSCTVEGAEGDALVPVLLHSLRSCLATLRTVHVPMSDLDDVVAAVREEPLLTVHLVALVGHKRLIDKYAGEADSLRAAGLSVWREYELFQ